MNKSDPIDTAWKIHAAITDWTGKVDNKASFALAIESALLTAVITLSGQDRALAGLSGWGLAWYILGVLLLAMSAFCAICVVRPRLRSQHLSDEAPANFIYFGHLRQLTSDEVEKHLNDTNLLPVLAKQLVEMSKIAWTKHRWVQWSLTLAPVGVVFLAISATYG